MSMEKILGIAASSMNAQMVRMNTTASNLANAGTVASNENEVFRAKRPIFQTLVSEAQLDQGNRYIGGVKIKSVVDDPSPVNKLYSPSNPLANDEGFVYKGNINEVTEMVEMMASARAYQNSVEVMSTARQLMMRTSELLKA